MRILIVSHTPWDENNSFGNTFSNFFGGNVGYEIANIYCMSGTPNTNVCGRFFQISEKHLLKNLLCRKNKSGIEVKNSPNEFNSDRLLIKKIKLLRWQVFFWVRDFIWLIGRWRSKDLDFFIDSFSPDLIFQPIYSCTYVNRIGQYVKKRTSAPMVGFVSDDVYTFKQFSLSPFFWFDRLIKRKNIRETIKLCKRLYTSADDQRDEYARIFKIPCESLYKGCTFYEYKDIIVHHPIRLVYTGNIGSGRWRVLAELVDVLKSLQEESISSHLFIYSASPVTKKMMSRLNVDGVSSFEGAVPVSKIRGIQEGADILVHVEPFSLSERYSARLSFSTKIIDYFAVGRCILAIGWDGSSSIRYLQRNNAAYVITSLQRLKTEIRALLSNQALIESTARLGYECGVSHHSMVENREKLHSELSSFV